MYISLKIKKSGKLKFKKINIYIQYIEYKIKL